MNESEAGARKSHCRPAAALPRPAGTAPRTGHRLRLPCPRVSPAFFVLLRIRAMGPRPEFPGRSRRASGADPWGFAVTRRPNGLEQKGDGLVSPSEPEPSPDRSLPAFDKALHECFPTSLRALRAGRLGSDIERWRSP